MPKITQKMWDELNDKYEQLRLNEEMYRVAIGLTDHTITVVDIPNRTLNQIYNKGDWTGVTVSMPNAPESIIETGVIHPEDIEGYRKFYEKIYSGVPKGEYTMRSKEEHRGWVWFRMIYQTVFDEDGNPQRAICFSDDITIQKKAELQYKQYKEIVSSDADFVWEANLSLDIMVSEDKEYDDIFDHHARQTYTELTEIAFNMIVDKTQRSHVMSVFSRDSLINAFHNAKREISIDYQFDNRDGIGVRWHHATAYLTTNIREEIIVIICVTNVSERYNKLEDLENRAQRDQLTGLYNRATMLSKAEQIIHEYPDIKHGFIIFDIDNFKTCNDTYGHSYGDDILCIVADTMTDAFRSSDILCRLGGDEFVIFMQNAGSRENVVSRSKYLQDKLMRISEERNLDFKISISIGASITQTKEDMKQIYLRADEALYMSKNAGKNRVTFIV